MIKIRMNFEYRYEEENKVDKGGDGVDGRATRIGVGLS